MWNYTGSYLNQMKEVAILIVFQSTVIRSLIVKLAVLILKQSFVLYGGGAGVLQTAV